MSREAYADNSSKYKVDGRKKTRSEVEQLLASKGIDLENNRFLILQVYLCKCGRGHSALKLLAGRVRLNRSPR